MLFATALTNESIADALAIAGYRDALHRAGARDPRRRGGARRHARGVRRLRPGGVPPERARRRGARSLDDLVAHNRRSAKTHSGIWRDLAVRKRPTEVDAQLGIVVTLGARAGVPTPLTARLVELIHEIESGGGRSRSKRSTRWLRHRPLRRAR